MISGKESGVCRPVEFHQGFDSTEDRLLHFEKSRCASIVTPPHVRSKSNYILHEADHTRPTLAV